MHVHTIYQPSESYTEKKAMRQFQLKLKKSCERVGGTTGRERVGGTTGRERLGGTSGREQGGSNGGGVMRSKDKRTRFPKILVRHGAGNGITPPSTSTHGTTTALDFRTTTRLTASWRTSSAATPTRHCSRCRTWRRSTPPTWPTWSGS